MEIGWTYAVLAGWLGTALMTRAMMGGRLMGIATDLVAMLGLMVVPPKRKKAVYAVGLAMHFGLGALFGVVYAVVLTGLGVVSVPGWMAIWGALLGLVHGVVVGVGMALVPAVHPRMGHGQVLEMPGLFGRHLGVGMPVALLLLHAIYGVTAAVTYFVGMAQP